MATTKIYDLAVKTGSYQDRNTGQEKGRYKNVGSVLKMEDGGKMILLDRSFNPAGVPFKEGSDQIVISMFEPKDSNGEQPPATTARRQPPPATGRAPAPQAASAGFDMDDDIPF
jgi:hypothetical protein